MEDAHLSEAESLGANVTPAPALHRIINPEAAA